MLLRYIARRIPYVIPQLFGIILVSFFMLKLIPGDPAVMMLGPMASQQSLAVLREKMGLSKPLWEQFFYYVHDSSTATSVHRGRQRGPLSRICFNAFRQLWNW